MRLTLSLVVFAVTAALTAIAQPPEAVFKKPEMTKLAKDLKPFEYAEAKIPFYPPSKKWGVQAEPIKKMQKPLSVEESLKHIVTPVDFEVKVFVTEEKLGGKPIAMNWDEQGRLWVSVTVDYPNNIQPAGRGNDKIVVCEDTNGDGVCDKVTTFADKLSIPTSLLPYAGGVIVHQAPVTLFLKDTDGDGKADVKQELLRGWATNDTHAGPSNLHYGFDNWIYGSVGYAGFNGTVGGEQLNFRQGFYRFKVEANPDRKVGGEPLKVTKLEFLRSTSNNTWGLCFNEAGELFGSTANGCPIVHMPIPNRYYEKVRGLTPSVLQNIAPDNHFEPVTEKVRQVDWHGGFTAASNIAIYTARTYPKEYWNSAAFISEPTGHLTATMMLNPSGADYRARYGWNLVASDDEWCAPIDAQVGPDGHVWVADWYAYIVQHNPTPSGFQTGKGNAFETDLRDKTYGRIYRVVYTKAKPEKPFTLKDASLEKLVETLKHPNMTWRLHAQRLLVEKQSADDRAGTFFLLKELLRDQNAEDYALVHALWAMAGINHDEDSFGWLAKRSPRAVAKAVIATAPLTESTAEMISVGYQVFDPETPPDLLLVALLKLSDMPEAEAANRIGRLTRSLSMLSSTTDRTISDALLIATSSHARRVIDVSLSAKLTWSPEGLAALERVCFNFAAKSPAGLGAWLELLTDSPASAAVVSGLSAGWPRGKTATLTDDESKALVKALGSVSPTSRGKLLRLASTWGVKGLDSQLAEISKAALATIADAKATDADRLAAAKQAIEFRPDSDEAATAILAVVTPEASPALVTGIFEALTQSKAKGLGTAIVGKLKDLTPATRPVALRLVLARTESAKAFLDAVEKGTLRFDMLALDQRAALATHPDKELADRAKKLLALGGGLPNPDRQKVIEEFKHILAKTGDAPNGKKAFAAHCAKCHKHSGDGTQIGPDLTGFAVHPKEEILIHVLDPSRSVEGNFKAYRVVTTDERTLIGILGAQTATSVEIIDGDAKRHAFNKDEIASMKETDKSLMPEGFEKTIKVEELIDLMEFLTQKGKYVPIPLDKVATIVSTKGMLFDEADTTARLVFPDWKPKMFDEVPFVLVDPEKDTRKNVVMLYGPQGNIPPKMPKQVSLPFNGKAKAIHILGGIGGWAAPFSNEKTVSMIVRVTYEDGKTEDHELKNAVHIADYVRKVDVPESKYAFALRNQQVRYLALTPKRTDTIIKTIELVKGPDDIAPIVMAITVETP